MNFTNRAIENVNGSQGDDLLIGDNQANNLVGNAGNNILVGNGGDDSLTGGAGNDILIGGLGADTLTGNAGDDIVIGGPTSFDANPKALLAIMAEWTSANTYDTRRQHLLNTLPGGLNGTNYLRDLTVFDDQTIDTIYGGDGIDWFWANANEIQDGMAGEKIGAMP